MAVKQKAPCAFLGLGGSLAIVARLKAGTDTLLEAANGSTEEATPPLLEAPTVVPESPPAAATAEKGNPTPKPANEPPASVVEPLEVPVSHPKRRR